MVVVLQGSVRHISDVLATFPCCQYLTNMKPSSFASSRDESGGEGDAPLIAPVGCCQLLDVVLSDRGFSSAQAYRFGTFTKSWCLTRFQSALSPPRSSYYPPPRTAVAVLNGPSPFAHA